MVYFKSILMKNLLKLIRAFFSGLSVIAPGMAARLAFLLFQTPMNKSMSEREESFYKNAERFIICHEKEDIIAYRLGNPSGKMVFLVHGWESNAGSLAAIAYSLVQQGFNVISFDLPAHGHSRLTRTNLLRSYQVFKAILDYFNPREFSVIAHSFGSAVTSYTLSHSKHVPSQLVYLTAPDRILDIFDHFRKTVKLGDRAYAKFLSIAQSLFEDHLSDMNVSEMTARINYDDLLLIHDRYDKILPYEYSERIYHKLDRVYLETFEKIGHYRMLWNPNVTISILSHWHNNIAAEMSVA